MPWQRFVWLLYVDLKSSVAPKELKKWVLEMEAPIPGAVGEGVDSEVLQSLIDMGQALDFEDAEEVFFFQQRQAHISDMAERMADAQRFGEERITRLRERGLIE